MKNYVNGEGIPLGFGMALSQNEQAMEHFAALTEDERQSIIDSAHGVKTKEEMRDFVNKLAR